MVQYQMIDLYNNWVVREPPRLARIVKVISHLLNHAVFSKLMAERLSSNQILAIYGTFKIWQ